MALHVLDAETLRNQGLDSATLLRILQYRARRTIIAYTLVIGQWDPCLPAHWRVQMDPFTDPSLPASLLIQRPPPIVDNPHILSVQVGVRLYSWGTPSHAESIGVLKITFDDVLEAMEELEPLGHVKVAIKKINQCMARERKKMRCTCA